MSIGQHNAAPSNPLGTAAFVLSLVAFFSAGCLSPISLILSIMAMQKYPKDLAVAGLVLSLIGVIPGAIVFFLFIVPLLFVVFLAASTADIDKGDMPRSHAEPSVVASSPADLTPAVTLSDIQRREREMGGYLLTVTVKNSSDKPITSVRAKIQYVDVNGDQLAVGNVTFTAKSPIAPGTESTATGTVAGTSPLGAEMPSTATPEITLVSAE